MKNVTCKISGKEVPATEAIRGEFLRGPFLKVIQKEHPELSENDFISNEELLPYRKKYVEELIRLEIGDLNKLEKEVVDAISGNKLLSENFDEDINDELTFGQRLADRIAEFGGSWTFIIVFFSFILAWMVTNVLMMTKAFDVYPFILLNLILSCLAAIQAPIIMMSQNRQEQKDRIRNEHDYKVNLKAELEIKLLHEKIDHLMINQNKRLLEIQEIQAEYLEDILKQLKK